MYKTFTLSASAALISCLFLITGCSSSDDGGTTTTTTASVPANAIVIDSTNAESTIASAAGTASTLGLVFGAETTQNLNLKGALDIISPLLDNISDNTTPDIATGVDFTEACSGGGSISGSITETDDGITFSEGGTISFNACNEFGFTINGSFSFSDTTNTSTGAFSENANGSLTMTADDGSATFSFTGFVFAETGNNFNNTYTTTQLTFALDFIVNGTAGGGFLVTLTAPIIESNGDNCPESGHITITGANGTTAEGIYNGDGTMTIKANGEIVTTTATCYA